MNMKKTFILIVAVAMLFTACANSSQQAAETDITDVTVQQETSEPTQEPAPVPAEETAAKTDDASASLPNTVAIALPMDRFAEAEFNPVINAVINAGYMPVMLGEYTGLAAGSEDNGVEVRDLFSEHSSKDLLGIIVIGGSDSLWENEELSALLLDMHENGRLTAAICLSSVTLAKAGIIGEGDSASWFNSDAADAAMQAAKVADSGDPVTVDGLIITGDGPDAADEFAQKVVEALDGM
jgi:protease I